MPIDYAYAGSYGNSWVAVIDPTSYVTVDTIPTPSQPNYATRTPNRRWLFVVAANHYDIYKIDTLTNAIVATIHVGPTYYITYLDSTDSFLYIPSGGDLCIVDVATGAVTGITSPYPPYGRLGNPVHTSDQRWVYFGYGVGGVNGYVFVLDTSTNTYSTLIPTGTSTYPFGGMLTNDDKFFYVSDSNALQAYKIDVATQTLAYTITGLATAAGDIFGWGVDANNNKIYLYDNYGSNTYIIDIAANTFVTITGPGYQVPSAVSVNFDTGHTYASGSISSTEIVFDTGSPYTQGTITLPAASGPGETSPDGSRLYIGSGSTTIGTGGVIVVDTASQTAITQSHGAGYDIRWVKAANPNPFKTGTVYTADSGSGTVTKVVAAVATPLLVGGTMEPNYISMTPDKQTLIVAGSPAKEVKWIDVPSFTVTHTVTTLGVDSFALGHITIQTTNNTAYVVDYYNPTVDYAVNIFDIPSAALTVRVSITSYGIGDICLLPNDKYLFVAAGSDGVYVIDVGTNAIVNHILVPPYITYSSTVDYLRSSADSSTVYCGDRSGNRVFTIDVASMTVNLAIAALSGQPTAPALSADGLKLFVPIQSGSLSVIDTASNTVISTAALPSGTIATQATNPNPLSTYTYIADSNSTNRDIHIVDMATGAYVSSLTLYTESFFSAVSPDNLYCYVVDNNIGYLSVIDPATNSLLGTVIVGILSPRSTPTMVCVGPDRISPAPIKPVVIQKIKVPPLFIPIKGLEATHQTYTATYFIIDWEAIERWGNAFAPTLFFPFKSEHIPPNSEQLNANWITFEVWAANKVIPLLRAHGNTYQPLYIPNKTSLKTIDVTVSFLAAQRWGNEID